MVDTVRTQTDLLANLFQDSQTAGSITAQDVRDLIVSIYDAQRITMVNDAIDLESANTDTIKFVSPVAGTIETIQVMTKVAVTGADGTITADIGGTGVTGGVTTIALSGAAVDRVHIATPSALNVLAVGDVVTLTVGGGNTAVGTGSVTLLIKPTIA